MDTTLAVLILTLVRLVVPFGLLLAVGTWLQRRYQDQAR